MEKLPIDMHTGRGKLCSLECKGQWQEKLSPDDTGCGTAHKMISH